MEKNNNDEKIFDKYQQLTGLGFTNVHIYIGGLCSNGCFYRRYMEMSNSQLLVQNWIY